MTLSISKIRFIGYSVPTTPAKLISIGNPNGPGSVAGTYLANANVQTDLQARVNILKTAVDLAASKLPNGETDTVNVFVAPEFYFHGIMGPYVYADDADDPLIALQNMLSTTFDAASYPNWTFVCGSAITTQTQQIDRVLRSSAAQTRNGVVKAMSEQWLAASGPMASVIFDALINFIKVCHSYPNCEVRNRSVIVSNVPIRPPATDTPVSVMTTEKYYCSNEDFLLYDVDGKPVVTEQMTAYPVLDLSGGDAKQSDFDAFAIFRQNNIDPSNPIGTTVTDYGVEICLDHSDLRLRRNIGYQDPSVISGIHVQLIPSCGMQISAPSIAAEAGGLVFNCDGQYALNTQASGAEEISGVNCVYANTLENYAAGYAAHTQLARVTTAAVGDNHKASGASNAVCAQMDAGLLTTYKVTPPSDFTSYFAGGAGEVHIYGEQTALTLYPT